MDLLKRLLKEPLVHFIAIAVALFVLYGVLNKTPAEIPDRIVITGARIEQLAAVFAKTWQRPPSAEELKGLVDGYVKEEIYVREAYTLGIDQEDTVIRRRLQQKMEFLNDAEIDEVAPTDAELEAYLKAHADNYRVEPMTAFEQVFLNPEKHGDAIDRDAAAILAGLLRDPDADWANLGDPTLLPPAFPLTVETSIDDSLGAGFADGLKDMAPGVWSGPVPSSYGLHVVRVTAREAGRLPDLAEVREALARDWGEEKRKETEKERFDALLARYEVVIEDPSKVAAAQ